MSSPVFHAQPPRTPNNNTVGTSPLRKPTTTATPSVTSPLRRPPNQPVKSPSVLHPSPRSPPPVLMTPPSMTMTMTMTSRTNVASSLLTEKERLQVAFNLIVAILTVYVNVNKTTTISEWTGLTCHYVTLILRAILALLAFNITWTLFIACGRFVKRLLHCEPLPSTLSPHHITTRTPKGTALRDNLPAGDSPRPSPLRQMAVNAAESTTTTTSGSSALTSSASQTPLKSPFAKQQQQQQQQQLHSTPFSQSASTSHLQPSSTSLLSSSLTTSSQTTPKTAIFTPSAKSINLRTPSALLTSPASPFTVKTPLEQQQRAQGLARDEREEKEKIIKPSSSANVAVTTNDIASNAADNNSNSNNTVKTPQTSPRKEPPKRRLVCGQECLVELSLQRDFEDRVESMRRWLWSMIIKPLVDDIDRVESAFQANGLSHLGPIYPASMTMLNSGHGGGGGTGGGGVDLRPAFYVSPGVVSATSRPQTLMELAQSSRHDPMVQCRLRIEKYLDVAAGVGQVSAGPRVSLVKRLRAMAASPAALFTHTSGDDSGSNGGDDALLLMHLFCTFLDDKLPSSDLYSAQPFTSRYFYQSTAFLDSADSLHCPIAIVQCSRQPPAFQLVTPDMVMTPVSTGNSTHHCLHVLVLFAACVEKRLAGHLGIANLRSRSVKLIPE